MNKRPNKVNRCDRLNAEFQREIYDVIKRKIKNPLITEMFSITKVDVAKDLGNARVYVSVFSKDEEKKNATFNAICSESKKIRYELAQTSNIRTVPELRFYNDDSMEYGDKMDKLFLKIEKEEKR